MQEGDIVKIDLLVATSGNRKSKDAWVRIKKDFEELAQQTDNTASDTCLKCEGSGYTEGEYIGDDKFQKVKCIKCDGTGKKESSIRSLPSKDEWESLVSKLKLSTEQAHGLYAWFCYRSICNVLTV